MTTWNGRFFLHGPDATLCLTTKVVESSSTSRDVNYEATEIVEGYMKDLRLRGEERPVVSGSSVRANVVSTVYFISPSHFLNRNVV